MTMQEYLAIKAVSAGVLRTLLETCPYAAWFSSPWNPEPGPADDNDASDGGIVCHSIVLEGSTEGVVVIDPNDHPAEKGGAIPLGFTNKSIRAARDSARLEGKIPILKKDFANIWATVLSTQRFIESVMNTEPAVNAAFSTLGGISEQTCVAEVDGLKCKIRPDRMAIDHKIIVDLKFPANACTPESWSRAQLVGRGLYLSAAFYQKVIEALTGVRPDYLFLITPTEPPHLPFLCGVEPHMLDLGHRKIEFALREWQRCVAANHWPAYEPRTYYAELPAWAEAQWLEREMQEPML